VGRALLLAVVIAGLILSGRHASAGSNAQQEAAQRLAQRIASIPGIRGPFHLDWHPDDAWTQAEGERWLDLLRGELEKHSVDLTDDANALALAVYAVQTPAQVVFTARVPIGDRDEIRILSVARASLPPAELPVAPVRLDRQMIYSSPDRILDASSLWNGAEGGLSVLLYKNYEVVAQRLDAQGKLQQTIPLTAAALKPTRDPRGEINPNGNMVSAQLWGKSCDFSWEAPGDVKCHTDKLVAASANSPWRGPTLLTSPCDGSGWRLVGSDTESNARAMLEVVPEGASRESSSAVLSEFPGPILNINGEQNPGSALVAARNLRTGNYEIYNITLACGD